MFLITNISEISYIFTSLNSTTLPNNSSINQQQHLPTKNAYSHAKNYNARSNAIAINTGNGMNTTGNGGMNIAGNGSGGMIQTGSSQHYLQVPLGLASSSQPSSPSMISRQIQNETVQNHHQRSSIPKVSDKFHFRSQWA